MPISLYLFNILFVYHSFSLMFSGSLNFFYLKNYFYCDEYSIQYISVCLFLLFIYHLLVTLCASLIIIFAGILQHDYSRNDTTSRRDIEFKIEHAHVVWYPQYIWFTDLYSAAGLPIVTIILIFFKDFHYIFGLNLFLFI